MRTTVITDQEAASQLGTLVDRVAAGEDVVIRKDGKAVRLVAVPDPVGVKTRPDRRPGQYKGRVWMAPDFDETPEWLIDAFEGRGDDRDGGR
ncbi:MAG: antitoxin [Caenispirillum bisanense]|nr:antitoxin [Caenispirillum bisanense]MCA1973127.1 antitoxin [Caenispirillum sp.]